MDQDKRQKTQDKSKKIDERSEEPEQPAPTLLRRSGYTKAQSIGELELAEAKFRRAEQKLKTFCVSIPGFQPDYRMTSKLLSTRIVF